MVDPEVSLISDSKGLYDALNNELPQDDKKSAVEMPIIESILKRMNGRSRWVPHNWNPADGLTKLRGAHLEPLMDLLKTGFYHLRTEEAELQSRAKQKEETGRTARLKQSGIRGASAYTPTASSMFVYAYCSMRQAEPPKSLSVQTPLSKRLEGRNRITPQYLGKHVRFILNTIMLICVCVMHISSLSGAFSLALFQLTGDGSKT